MEVHKILGNGFQEVIYQRALDIEMRKNQGPELAGNTKWKYFIKAQ